MWGKKLKNEGAGENYISRKWHENGMRHLKNVSSCYKILNIHSPVGKYNSRVNFMLGNAHQENTNLYI